MKPNGNVAKALDERKFKASEWPFFWMIRASSRYLQAADAVLKPIGLDVPRWRVLMSLYEKDTASVSELAERSVIRLNTMTKIVQRMQLDGLVTCRPRATDSRVTEVMLTEAGEAARKRARREVDRISGQVLEPLGERNIQTLNRLLQKVFDGFDTAGAER